MKGTELIKILDATRAKPVTTRKLEATTLILNGIVTRTPIASNSFMFGNFEPKISVPKKNKEQS